jgi:hypothetical protein
MTYVLEFPPSTLPENIQAPPFVIFGINGCSVVEKLPLRIPLNAILHFIPKLAQWILPAPEDLPPTVAQGALRTPYVGIDIRLDIGIASLQCIILKVLQSAGTAVPKHQLQHPPPIITSISIRKTWLLLELPKAGLDGLLIHLQTLLMTGPAVTFTEMRELWAAFSSDFDMLRVMTINFVQSHIALLYSHEEFADIRKWYMSTKERYNVFKHAEAQFPAFSKPVLIRSNSQVRINETAAESVRKARERDEMAAKNAALVEDLSKRLEALESKRAKKGPRRMSMEDVKSHSTIRKSMKWRWSEELGIKTANMDDISAKLSDALRRVELEQESKSVVAEHVETLPPTVYDPSKAST